MVIERNDKIDQHRIRKWVFNLFFFAIKVPASPLFEFSFKENRSQPLVMCGIEEKYLQLSIFSRPGKQKSAVQSF
jgi:hypothetical protein